MAVSVNEDLRTLHLEFEFHPRRVFSGVSADVGHRHAHSVGFPVAPSAESASHRLPVDVSSHSPHRSDGVQTLEHLVGSYVAGMPNFVASCEMRSVAVVPISVGVGKYANFLHYSKIQ